MSLSANDETLLCLAAMCGQEEHGYGRCDFFKQQREYVTPDVNTECRSQMINWCFGVTDFCKFSHNSVEVSISYLDRFLCTPAGVSALGDRWVFQLASMTALYTAVKLHEPEVMDPLLISTMSRGLYTSKDIEAMETMILTALEWRMNPPTTANFVQLLLKLIPDSTLNMEIRETVLNIATIQTEASFADYAFVSTKASRIAYCALMNALESVNVLHSDTLGYLGYILAQAIGISNSNDPMVVLVQNRLYETVLPKLPFLHQKQEQGTFTSCDLTDNARQQDCTKSVNVGLEVSSIPLGQSPRNII